MSKKRPFRDYQVPKARDFMKWFRPSRERHRNLVRQANDWVEAYPSAYVAWKAMRKLGVK